MSPRTRGICRAVLFLFSLFLVATSVVAAAPSITSLTPTSGAVGASITIAGSGFGSTQGTSTVKFNGTTATVTSWSATSIVATVPTGATTGNVVVTVSGTASAGKSFTVVAAPSITSLAPSTGAVGVSVTIAGTSFGATQGTSTVKFNGTSATVTTWSATSVVVTVPSAATTGNVVVHASGVDSNGKTFTVLPTPSITSLTPSTGAVGASVTIAGANFGATQGTSTVKFNGTTATITSWSATSIVAAVPIGGTTGNVIVTVSGVASSGKTFTVVAAPSITSLTPTSGAVGASVTIAGASFGATQGTSTVKFNGTTATVTTWSATSVVVTVPTGATTGNVVVHASGVDSNGNAFTVLGTPSITSLTPSTGAVGASVTIAGANFGATQGTSTVKFNGTTATVTSWGASSIVATVPTGATTGNVVVNTSGVNSNGKSFTVVAAPSITSLTPATGGVGASVTIAGTSFGATQGTSTVKFNGTTATVTTWSATSVAVTVPTGATTGNVIVHASGVDSNGKPFTVLPSPTITSLSPNSGIIGDSVTITGTNFGATQGTSTVKFNGTTATPIDWSATTIDVTVPTGAASGNVVVTVSGVASAGVSFTVFVTPSITSLSPTSGAVGTSVTIQGTGFQATQNDSTVMFNGVAATPTTWTGTQIKAPVPSGATTGAVRVIVGGLASNVITFTVKPTPTISSASPPSGAAGVVITITGTNFGSTQGSSTVKFNGTTATPTIWSATQITVPVPAGATTGNLVVHTSGIDVSAGNFNVVTITSLAVTPSNLTLPLNSRQRFVALATNSDGSTEDIANTAAWSSSFTTVGAIDATGVFTALAQGQTTIQATFGTFTGSTTITIKGRSFVPMGSMNQPREAPTATLLPNGKVFVAGGFSTDSITATAELYDPATKAFSWTGGLNTARELHTATLLSNGQVLIVGGNAPIPNAPGFTQETNSAELYNPATGHCTPTGSLNDPRYGHTATLLPNGKVLIVGGFQNSGNNSVGAAELYDPATGTFTLTGSLVTARTGASATLLNDGTVLVAGGLTSIIGSTVATTEIYDPGSGAFSAIANLPAAQYDHSATLLSNGTVLLAGGDSPLYSHAFIYDPIGKTFTTIPSLAMARSGQTATLLNDGTVLMVGGEDPSLNLTYTTAEFFSSATRTFTGAGATATLHAPGNMSFLIIGTPHTATLLGDGTVLVTGGNSQNAVAELYEPGLPAPVSLQIIPASASMLTGDTKLFSAVDDQGQQRSDALWTVSDTNVATLPSNISPTLTAVNPGQVTLTADVDGVQAQAQVTVAPHSLQITPGTANMLIGDSRQFTVVDERGNPSPIATWTVSDGSLAQISTDSSPILTALASGQVTVTANVEGVSTQIQVNISPLTSFQDGTVLWAIPPASGFTPLEFDYAVPTTAGPTVYNVQSSSDGTQTLVQALTDDGQQIWQTILPKLAGPVVPDGFGGLLATEACNSSNNIPMNIVDLNPATGQLAWQLPIPTPVNGVNVCLAPPKLAIRHDGAVVVAMPLQISPPVWVLDGKSGAVKSNPSIPSSTLTDAFGQTLPCDCLTPVGQPSVDGDGSIVLEYEVRQIPYPPTTVNSTLSLMRIALDGTTTTTQLSSSSTANLFPGNAVPDGNGNLLATWTIVPASPPAAAQPYQAAYVSSGVVANTYPLPMAPTQVTNGPDGLPSNFPLVLGENGTAFVSYGLNLVSFDRAAAALHWSYPAPSQSAVSILAATVGQSVAAKLIDQSGVETMLQLDSTGSATTSSVGGSQFKFSWEGQSNAFSSGSFAAVSRAKVPVAATFWALRGGNHSGNGMAIEQVQSNKPQGDEKQLPNLGGSLTCFPPFVQLLDPPPGPTCVNINVFELITDKSPDYIFQHYIQTYLPGSLVQGIPNNEQMIFTNGNGDPLINVTLPGQKLSIILRGIGAAGQVPFSVLTERVDPVNHVISVVTLKGHPLAGWRYWRVYSIGTNDVVIETGAYDQPGPGIANYLGYYLGREYISVGWEHYLRFIQNDLHASNGSSLNSTVGGVHLPVGPVRLQRGYWDYWGSLTGYILDNVCQSSSCN